PASGLLHGQGGQGAAIAPDGFDVKSAGDIEGRHGPGVELYLAFLAAETEELTPMVLILDAFGQDHEDEDAAHVQDGSADSLATGVPVQGRHEGTVDLQPVNGQELEVAQGGVPHAEVVHGDGDTHFLQAAEDPQGHVRVPGRHGLGDLDL